MATFYPDTFPGEVDDNNPEFEVYQILDALPDHYTVFYSKRIVGTRNARPECEIDFVIFDGQKNLIALEVKGGLIEYDGSISGWSQNGNPMSKDPDRQASSACHTLIQYLGADAEPINIGWALAFPDCISLPHMSTAAEVPAELILDQQDLLDPVAGIRTVETYHEERFNRRGVSPAAAQALLQRLNRTLGFVTRVGVRLAGAEQALLRVTNEQLEILHDLDHNDRMIIRGGAGTGKTLIAQEFAKRQAEAGNKVLLLFYNRCIANTVRYGLGRDSPIECSTFHRLARRIITDNDHTWWEENSTKEDTFWNDTVPLKLIDCEIAPSEAYDTIIIDEGQDFKPDWFETLERLLKNQETGRFVVFYDENQNVFGRWDDVPWGSTGIARKVLTKNCRNSRNIIDHLNDTMGTELKPYERSPLGEPVVRTTVRDNDEEQHALEDLLRTLLREDVAPGDIVILLNSPRKESSIADLQRVGRVQLDWMGKTYRQNSRAIQITTIESFKGLEAKVIIILGHNSDISPEQLYTQCSRASLLLHIFERPTAHS